MSPSVLDARERKRERGARGKEGEEERKKIQSQLRVQGG